MFDFGAQRYNLLLIWVCTNDNYMCTNDKKDTKWQIFTHLCP